VRSDAQPLEKRAAGTADAVAAESPTDGIAANAMAVTYAIDLRDLRDPLSSATTEFAASTAINTTGGNTATSASVPTEPSTKIAAEVAVAPAAPIVPNARAAATLVDPTLDPNSVWKESIAQMLSAPSGKAMGQIATQSASGAANQEREIF